MWDKLDSSGGHAVWSCSIYFCYTAMPFVHALLRVFLFLRTIFTPWLCLMFAFIKKKIPFFLSLGFDTGLALFSGCIHAALWFGPCTCFLGYSQSCSSFYVRDLSSFRDIFLFSFSFVC